MQYTYTRWRHYCTLVVTAVRLPTTDLVYSWIAIQSWYYSSFIRQTEARASTQPQAAVKPPRSGFDVPWIAPEPRSDPDWELTTSEMKIWWREAPKEEYLAGFFPFFFSRPPRFHLQGNARAPQLFVAVAKAMWLAAAGGQAASRAGSIASLWLKVSSESAFKKTSEQALLSCCTQTPTPKLVWLWSFMQHPMQKAQKVPWLMSSFSTGQKTTADRF